MVCWVDNHQDLALQVVTDNFQHFLYKIINGSKMILRKFLFNSIGNNGI